MKPLQRSEHLHDGVSGVCVLVQLELRGALLQALQSFTAIRAKNINSNHAPSKTAPGTEGLRGHATISQSMHHAHFHNCCHACIMGTTTSVSSNTNPECSATNPAAPAHVPACVLTPLRQTADADDLPSSCPHHACGASCARHRHQLVNVAHDPRYWLREAYSLAAMATDVTDAGAC
jgi:hypothetical protein